MAGFSKELAEEIWALRRRRYPDLLIVHSAQSSMGNTTAREAATEAGIEFVDFREIVRSSSPIVPGGYHRTEFRDWLKDRALASDGILVVNADEILSPWDSSDRLAFFREFLHIECRRPTVQGESIPIVLVTEHDDARVLPSKEHGQGKVLFIGGA